MWNQPAIGGVVTPARVRIDCRAGQPSEGGQRRSGGSARRLEAAPDPHRDVRAGPGDSAENLARAGRRLDVADANLQMSFPVVAAKNERRVPGEGDR